MNAADVETFEECIASGGLALFPSDTVYGLAADPDSEQAVRRLCDLKQRSLDMPSAVMFFALDPALEALAGLGDRTVAALGRLLPGPLTAVVPNPEGRYPLACGPDPDRVGLRVPRLERRLSMLRRMRLPVLQSSANRHGRPDPRRLEDVDPAIRRGADLELDGGALPGVASTVVDLSGYEADGRFEVLREGAVSAAEVERRLVDIRLDD